ncbi:MAG: transposase, partial [Alphaproteobacteria bacterium]|nr:transposase [Alphaproteobacteria bacterium]
LQIDFGETRVSIGGVAVRIHLFVATLGYSRRLYVQPFRSHRQENWLAGLQGAFRRFGGITEEVLFDNDRGLVVRHDHLTREVEFNARLRAFAKHWGFRPRACAPYRACTLSLGALVFAGTRAPSLRHPQRRGQLIACTALVSRTYVALAARSAFRGDSPIAGCNFATVANCCREFTNRYFP